MTNLIENIKNSGAAKTKYGTSMYSDLWYVDTKNKLCITFTPRGGCSISFTQYLDLLALLDDATNNYPWIHDYRTELLNHNIQNIPLEKLINQNYTFIKFIMNPYIRAVSIFRAQTSHNLSFREYLKQLVNNQISYFIQNDKYHYHPQYIDGEETIITKYIKIDENEKYTIKLHDNTNYELDVNKYTSCHHGKRTDFNEFCGDTLKDDINQHLPKTYKYFYDDEIKKMVEKYYKNDIEKYGYSFEF
jgi:hypothetical protein